MTQILSNLILNSFQVIQKIWIRMSWRNELMVWNASQFGGVSMTRMASHLLWTPDIFLQEDISSDMSTGPEKYKTMVNN